MELLDANNGEIWGKLDAGTEAYYREVDRTAIPLARVLENLTEAAQVRPIVIQSLFMRIRGEATPPAGTGGLLPAAGGDRGGRREDQARAGSYYRPASGRELGQRPVGGRGRKALPPWCGSARA